MAYTKIHAIKATVSGAVNYICNEKKTDSSIYISSFATSPQTAAKDFQFTLSHTDRSDPNLAYHLIQSFAPGEVGAEEAHRIGEELADRLLKGRYSYIVSTHTDKGHIHNHILFCAADNIDYHKYHDCKSTYHQIRQISDELCEEHNLSVIREKKDKAKSYKEWLTDRNGTSWKSQLKTDINEAVRQAHTYEEFLSLMQAKGYEIKNTEFGKDAHKYIEFRAPGQERWTRGKEKTLGAEYTRERIRERIEEKALICAERMAKANTRPASLIDTSEERFADSPGLKRWAEKQNLKAAARMQSKLAEMGFKSLEDVDAQIASLHEQAKTGKKTTVQLDKQLKTAGEILSAAKRYDEYGKYARAYRKSKDPDRYFRAHRYEISVAEGAADMLKSAGIKPDAMKLEDIEKQYNTLAADRKRAYSAYKTAEREYNNLQKMRDDLASYINEPTKSAGLDIENQRDEIKQNIRS